MSKKKLGRGLDALLSTPAEVEVEPRASTQTPAATGDTTRVGGIIELQVSEVTPSPFQPRRHFDEEAIADLANSIKTNGLLQPIVVRTRVQGGFELIAGERRLRAATAAGLVQIPAVVRTVSDEEASALALIENMQREDLSALEEAQGLARLRDEFALTQQEIADAVGKSRVAVANLLRLLSLGSTTRGLLEAGDLDMGHARALLALDGLSQDQAARSVVAQHLSVRQTEALVKKILNPKVAPKPQTELRDAETSRLEQRLMDRIGAPVLITHSASGRGELKISYSTLEELEGVLVHFGLTEE